MTDHDISELLERLGERTAVRPAPTATMLATAAHARRRRTTWLAVGAAALLAVTIGGTAVLKSAGEETPSDRHPAVPTPTQLVTPPGTRLVGIGHAAIAVPEQWGTNRMFCATPLEDTVVIDLGAVCLAYRSRPRGVESVEVHGGWFGGVGQQGEVATEPFEVDGEPAERIATDCPPEYNGISVCRGAVYLPGADVTFVAESSSEDSRAKVDEILSWILVVPDRAGVPGFQDINFTWYHAEISPAQHYRAALESLGLRVETVARKSRNGESIEEGDILGVDPLPGSMLALGSLVTVTEVAPRG